MSPQHSAHEDRGHREAAQIPDRSVAQTASGHGAVMTPAAARIAAIARMVLGFVFVWAFLDKTFGWGYATDAKKAWIEGGSPTRGFLSTVAVGPLESSFHNWAGDTWADWLFMLGLGAIGLAVVLGIALRPAALAGTVLMAFMWAAEWPPAQHASDGKPTMSTNPIVDYHVVYAVLLIVLAAVYAGNTWGLGRAWARLPVIRSSRWLL
ncbi:DoxX family membrane protein [Actinomadura latina]|nr:DoxX family membrane protein [Actinomadura latina]